MATNKIGFTIEVEGDQKLINNLDQAAAAAKTLKKQLKETSDEKAYSKLEKELIKLTAEQKRLQKERRKQIKDQQRVLELAELEEGSYRKQEIILAQLKDEYKKLGKAKRESAEGKELLKEINLLDKEVKNFGKSIGENFRNVGNYEEAIKNAFGGFGGQVGEIVGGFKQIGNAAGAAGKAIATGFIAFQAISVLIEAIGYIDDFVQATREAQRQIELTFGTAGEATDLVTSKIQGLATTFNTELDPALKGVNAIVSEFGGDAAEATELLAAGLTAAADQGQLLSSIDANLQKVSSAGLNASESIALLTEVSNRGINVDVISKGIANLRQQTDATRDSIENAFGEKRANEIFKTFSEKPAEAVKLVSSELQNLNLNSKEAAEVINNVFGRSGKEDLTTIANIATLNLNLDELKQNAGESAQRFDELRAANENFAKAQIEVANSLKQITGTSQTFTTDLKTGALLVLNELILAVKPVINSFKNLASIFKSSNEETGKFKAIVNLLTLQLKVTFQIISFTVDQFTKLLNILGDLINEVPIFTKIISTIKKSIDIVVEGLLNLPVVFEAITAAVIQTGKNISTFFKSALLQAKIFNKEIEKLNPFGKTTEQINNEISALKRQQSKLNNETRSIAEAFGEAYNAGLKRAEEQRIKDRELAQQQLNAQQKKALTQEGKAAARGAATNRENRKKEADKTAKELLKKQEDFLKNSIKLESDRQKLIAQLGKQLRAAQIANIEDEQQRRTKALENSFKEQQSAIRAQLSATKAAQKEQLSQAVALFGAQSDEVAAIQLQQQNEIIAIQAQTDKLLLENKKKFEREKLKIEQDASNKAAQQRLAEAAELNALLIEQEKTKLSKGLITEEEFNRRTIELQKETTKEVLKELDKQIEALSIRDNVDKDSLNKLLIERERIYQNLAELDKQDAENAAKASNKRLKETLKQVDGILKGIAQFNTEIDNLFKSIADKETARIEAQLTENEKAQTSLEERLNNAAGLERQFLERQLQDEKRKAADLEREKERIAKREAKRQKAFAISQAVINGALAVTNILATVPKADFGISSAILIGKAIATTALQVATISQQQFARGGIVGPGNIPTQKNGDNVLATLKTGEVVLNKSQQSALGGPRALAAAGVPGFALGGLVGPPLTPSTYQSNAERASNEIETSFSIIEATRRTEVVLNTDEQIRQNEDRAENINIATLTNDSN